MNFIHYLSMVGDCLYHYSLKRTYYVEVTVTLFMLLYYFVEFYGNTIQCKVLHVHVAELAVTICY